MKYNNIEFEAIIATPGVGKSFLCDNDKRFIDADEERLRCKYYVPDNISREKLERTKGNRTFKKRVKKDEYIDMFYKKLDDYVKEEKIIIAAPHPESFNYFASRNMKFVFIYPSLKMRKEMIDRMIKRGNSNEFVDDNNDLFEDFYKSNAEEKRSAFNYEMQSGEYLSEIIKKFEL